MGSFRTDLAMEAFDGRDSAPGGVEVRHWETGGIWLTEVLISEDAAARQLEKPRGRYLTLECRELRRRDVDARHAMTSVLSEELGRLLPEDIDRSGALVIGLGNRDITPDSLGPAVVGKTLVTRHIRMRMESLSDLRDVSAVAPGVLGVTGVETMDVVEALVGIVRPAAVICVDSLAARDSGRIGSTIQLTDTGIQPGAGVGNHRRALTRDSVGAPVIAIGMPTVIHAATLARDAFSWLDRESGDVEDREAALADMERALLSAELGGMIVTPREIDAMIQDAAGIIAAAINRALQPELTDAEIELMIN